MKKIVITYPDFFPGEAEELIRMLHSGDIWRVHIRKPGHDAEETASLIEAIPRAYRHKLTIHYHPELAEKYELGGVHLNSRCCSVPRGWRGYVSRSFHSLEEIGQPVYDYAFLSPIFPSISKPGYSPTLSPEEIRAAVDGRIFALGGVTDDRLSEVESMRFGGAALLGSVWRREIDMDAFRLQFITHPVADRPAIREAEEALAGGCRWVQLRHKRADADILLYEGRKIADLCHRSGAIFIINDKADLVEAVGADGVHLGKNDMPAREARRLLGPRKIIGATANTFEDIRQAYLDGADYIGLGPFRFTTTKSNLSPVLGLDGYREITGKVRAEGIGLPIVAIGGIKVKDIGAVMQTGAHGIAMSSEIINAADPVAKTESALREVMKKICPADFFNF